MATAGRWLGILKAIDVCHKKSCCMEDSTINHALAKHPLPLAKHPLPDDTEGERERTSKTTKGKGAANTATGKGAWKTNTGKGASKTAKGKGVSKNDKGN